MNELIHILNYEGGDPNSKQPFETLKTSEIKEGDENYKWCLFADKWGKRLGLEDQPITVLIETKENASKRNFKKVNPMANMGWNPIMKQWQIKYKYPLNELSCIHEFGHIYLAVQLNDLDYITHSLIEKNNFTTLYNILNDQFVNYKLFKFPEFRGYLEKRFIKYMNRHKIPVNKNIYHYWILYFSVFLESTWIITKKTKEKHFKTSLEVLKKIRYKLFKSYQKESIEFPINNFQKINSKLNQFKVIRNSKESKKLKIFIGNVLLVTKLWAKEEIIKLLKEIFN